MSSEHNITLKTEKSRFAGKKWGKWLNFELKNGAPGGTRTHDPLLRRQM